MRKKDRIPLKKMLTVGLLPSPIKVFIYKLRGAKIGKNVHIGIGSIIVADSIEIGDNTKIGFASVIRARKLKLGKNVEIGAMTFFDAEEIEIGDESIIREQVYVGGMTTPQSKLKIGKRVKIFQFTFLNPTMPIIIEDDVGIGGRCSIFTHSSWQSVLEGYPVKFAPVVIKRGAWLPWHVFVLPGVTIGEGATIGANSLVAKDIPPYSLAVGIPAKVIKSGENYPMRIDDKAKLDILIKILDEFADYLRYYGADVEKTSISDDVVKYEFKWRGRGKKTIKQPLIFVSGDLDDEKLRGICCELGQGRSGVILSMHAVDEKGMPDEMMWFDIERKVCWGCSNELGEELRAYLSRYGIRFGSGEGA